MTVPVRIVHGAKDGPTVSMFGSIHGDELNGMATINRRSDYHLDFHEGGGDFIARYLILGEAQIAPPEVTHHPLRLPRFSVPSRQAVARHRARRRRTAMGRVRRHRMSYVVEADKVIGDVTDVFGDVVQELRSPYKAVILDIRHWAPIMPGEWTVHCGQLA